MDSVTQELNQLAGPSATVAPTKHQSMSDELRSMNQPLKEKPGAISQALDTYVPSASQIGEAGKAIANTGIDIASGIPAGLYGAAKVVAPARSPNSGGFEGAMGRGFQGFQQGMETAQTNVPRFQGPGVQEAQQTIGEGLDALQQGAGSAVNWVSKELMDLAQVKLDPRTEMLREAGARTFGEAASNFLPIPGLEGAAGLVSKVPLIGSAARAAARGGKEYGSWGFPPQPKPSLEDYGRLTDPAHPDWFPDLTRSLAEGGMEFTEGGQGKRENISPTLDTMGMRGKEGYFAPEMTPEGYAGSAQPRAPIPDNSIDYKRHDPEGIHQLMEAEDTPGFLQTAEHKIALRFDRIRQLEATSKDGLEKLHLEENSAKPGAEDATKAIDAIPIPKEVKAKAEESIASHPMARYTEYLPADQAWLLRDHNRLSDPKSDKQWSEKEASVLKKGINEPLELKYSIADGKVVVTNGNTRTALGMKHGEPELPYFVTVIDKPLTGTEAVNGVPIGKFDVRTGYAKPSDIGLHGRPVKLPPGFKGFGQKGAVDFRGFMRETLDTQRVDESVRWDKRNVDPTTVMPDFYRRQPGEQPKLPGWAKKQYGMVDLSGLFGKGKRTPKDLLEVASRLGGVEKRSLQQVVDDNGIARNNLPDISSAERDGFFEGITKAIGRNVLDMRSIRKLFEGTPIGPIFRALEQRSRRIDLDGQLRLDDDLYGTTYGVGKTNTLLRRDFESRQHTTTGALKNIDNIAALGKNESTKFVNTWRENQGKTDDIPFDHPKAKEAYENLHKIILNRLEAINAKRVAIGKERVEPIPGYMPMQRKGGDYVLTTIDPATGKKSLYVLSSMREGRRVAADLRKQFPNLDIGDVAHKKLDKLDDVHMSALYETARALTSGDPVAKAVNDRINQLTMQRGAGGHFRARSKTEIGGYLGSTGDIKELRQGIVSYLEDLNKNEANLDRSVLQKELDTTKISGPPEPGRSVWRENAKTGGRYQEDQTNSSLLKDIAPNFHEFMTQFLEKSKGSLTALDQFDKAIVDELGKGLKIGSTGLVKFLYKATNSVTMAVLFKSAFWMSQGFQHVIMTPPRLMSILADVKVDQGFMKEFFVGNPKAVYDMSASMLKSVFYTAFPGLDHTRGEVVNYAMKNGYLNAAQSHMLESPDAYGVSKRFYQVTGSVEREGVRIPALIAIEDFLRPYIKDKQQRFEVASEQMFDAMAGTTRSNSPLLYNKMGPFGIPARALKSFNTNWHGQLAQYAVDASRSGYDMSHMRTLGTFAATNALFAGILGLIGVADATAIINIWNALTNGTVRTPQEWFLTDGNTQAARDTGGINFGPDLTEFFQDHPTLKNVVTLGAASAMLGHNIQPQVQAPTIGQLFTVVPLRVAIQVFEPLKDYAVAAAQNQMTDAVKMRVLMGLTINNPHLKAAIEQWFQQPGQPVPHPDMNMGGNYYRDQPGFPQSQSYTEAIIAGAQTVEEKKADLLWHFFKSNELRLERDRNNTLNSITDDILAGKVDQDKIQHYIQQGGSGKALSGDIKNTIIQRQLPGLERELAAGAKSKSPAYARKFQQLQPYMSNDPVGNELRNMQKPGPQSAVPQEGVQLAADTSTSIPGVSGAPIPQQPPRPNMYQGDGIVRGSDTLNPADNPILSDTNPPPSWAQNLDKGDMRYYGDKIDPYHNYHPGRETTDSILGREGKMNWRPEPENRTRDKNTIERKRPPKTRSM